MAFIPSTEDQWVFCQNLYKNGKKVAYSRKSMFFNETIYYDKDGKKIGSSKPDWFRSGQTNYFDVNGKEMGKSQKDIFFGHETTYYDKNNKKVGTSKPSYFETGKTYYYDEDKKKKGESRRSLWDIILGTGEDDF